jgi:hypothetical protein
MTLGEHIAQRTLQDVVEGQAKLPSTKRILRRCIPQLRTVIDEVASIDAAKMALPACYGRHIIFASPARGMVCDMLHWADPVQELVSDEKEDHAGMWAALTSFIYKADSAAALLLLATRLGKQGIADFEASFSNLDQSVGQVVFQGIEQETGADLRASLMARGALVVLAGVESGIATGIIGALPLPVLAMPGPVADWHEVDWSADGNHRRLH